MHTSMHMYVFSTLLCIHVNVYMCAIVSTCCIPVYAISVCPNPLAQMEGANQMESAPPPSRSPGNNPAELSIWCLSSICGAPHRLLLEYPVLIPPHSPDLADSTPPTPPPSPAPLVLHWENIASPGPWAEVVSEEVPVPSRPCHAEPEALTPARTPAPLSPPAPPFPFPPEDAPTATRSLPGELRSLLLTAMPAPDEPGATPLPADPPVLTPSAPPAWECAK